MTFCQVFPCPPSANRLWRHGKGRTYKSREYRQWLDAVAALATTWEFEIIEGPYRLTFYSDRPHGSRDLGNLEKPLSDALEHIGAVANDRNCISILGAWRIDSRGNVQRGDQVTVKLEAA